jgi:hypothetical protein
VPSREKVATIKKSQAMIRFVEYARAYNEVAPLLTRPVAERKPPEMLPDPESLADEVTEESPEAANTAAREKVFRELARRFRREWTSRCFRPGDFQAGLLLDMFRGMAQTLGAIAALSLRQVSTEIYLARLFPTPATRLRIENGKLRVERAWPRIAELREDFFQTLDGLDSTRVRRCEHKYCRSLFWATRKDQKCCSPKCGQRQRALDWYNEHSGGKEQSNTKQARGPKNSRTGGK